MPSAIARVFCRFGLLLALAALCVVALPASAMAGAACQYASATPGQAGKRAIVGATLCTIYVERGSFVDRIRRAGYLKGARSWTVGENLAWGSRGRAAPQMITQSWMNSPGHRANILNSSFREIGIGVAHGAPVAVGGPAATYATEFGTRG